MSTDPEVRALAIATARAYAIAERLASELENTVEDLVDHIGHRPSLAPAGEVRNGGPTSERASSRRRP